jgi:hypothetical protein
MKKIIISVFVVLFLWSCEIVESRYVDVDSKPNPKIGETWAYVPYSDLKDRNPFEDQDTIYFKVLDIKGKWIKYERLLFDGSSFYVSSSEITTFKVDSNKSDYEPK